MSGQRALINPSRQRRPRANLWQTLGLLLFEQAIKIEKNGKYMYMHYDTTVELIKLGNQSSLPHSHLTTPLFPQPY